MTVVLPSFTRRVRQALTASSSGGHAALRDKKIVHGIFSALANRGVAVLVSFISVPLTVRYLGAERYGAWVTISTLIAWVALADFGLSNSLTNAVSEGYASGRRDVTRDSVTAAFWSLAAIGAGLAIAFFSVWRRIPWDRVFNVQGAQARAEIAPAVAMAFVIFVLNFPFSIVAKIYGAYQEVSKANAWSAAGNLLGLAALIAVTRLRGGLPALVVAISGMLLFTNMLSAIWLFFRAKPWLFPDPRYLCWASVKKLSSLGGMFFVIQIAVLILFQTDNLIIAHYLGAAAVTPYSVTWRLFSYTAIFQTLVGPSYWPAYSEAFSRGDYDWVRKRFRMNLKLTFASTLLLTMPLLVFGRWIIGKWAGDPAVPTQALIVWMGIWSMLSSAMTSQACLLASAGRIKVQMTYSVISSAVNIVLSIALVQRFGLTGVIMGTVGAYVLCVTIPQSVEVERCLEPSTQAGAQNC